MYLQCAAIVKSQIPTLAVFQSPPFRFEAFDTWASSVALHVRTRNAGPPADPRILELQNQVNILLAENTSLRSQAMVMVPQLGASEEPVVPPTLSPGETIAECLHDWAALVELRDRKKRDLDALLPGLGQRVGRLRKVVCVFEPLGALCWL